MGITWDEAQELATDRAEWRQRVAQCIHIWMRDELRSKVRTMTATNHDGQINDGHKQ